MANELDTIMSALGGGGGFFDSPQTALEATQLLDVARRRQQQRDQLDFLTGLLEAKTSADIRTKQATDPEARIVQLLQEGQFAPTAGTVQGKPVTLPPSGDVVGQLTTLLGLQTAKGRTGARPDNLGEILKQMDSREKVVRDLTTQFVAAQTAKDKVAMQEIQKKLIAERGALLRDMETMQQLGPEWGALAQGFGSRMATAFQIAGVPFSLRPEAGQAPAGGGGGRKEPEEAPKRRELTPEQRKAGMSPTGTAQGDIMLLLRDLFDIVRQSQFPASP